MSFGLTIMGLIGAPSLGPLALSRSHVSHGKKLQKRKYIGLCRVFVKGLLGFMQGV